MPHNLDSNLEELKDRFARQASLVQASVESAMQSLYEVDERSCTLVIEGDDAIDREEIAIEQQAVRLLALFHPAAGDLRWITTILRVNTDLERVADCAVNIAETALPLLRERRYQVPEHLRLLGNSLVATLRDAIKSFNLSDEQLARHVLRSDDVIDALYHQIVQDLLVSIDGSSHGANTPAHELANLMIAKNLERIGDHCTNIAEDVIYIASGRIVRHVHRDVVAAEDIAPNPSRQEAR